MKSDTSALSRAHQGLVIGAITSVVILWGIISVPVAAQSKSSAMAMKIYTRDQELATIAASQGAEAVLEEERDHRKQTLDAKKEDGQLSIKDYYDQRRADEKKYFDDVIETKKRLRDQLLEFHLVAAAGTDRRSHATSKAGLAREDFAHSYETKMLDHKLNYEVTTESEEAKVLVIKWERIDRVYLHQLDRNEVFLRKLKALGFTRVVATNGATLTGIKELG